MFRAVRASTELLFAVNHFHIKRVVRKDVRLDAQRGHTGPSSYRNFAMKSTQVAGVGEMLDDVHQSLWNRSRIGCSDRVHVSTLG